MYVLDSWAILAWMQNEKPAADRVAVLLNQAAEGAALELSAINAGEVYYIVARRAGLRSAEKARQGFMQMPVDLVEVTSDLIWRAAGLKARYPLSYADAFAGALALEREAVLVTGDQEFKPLIEGEGLQVEWLARR